MSAKVGWTGKPGLFEDDPGDFIILEPATKMSKSAKAAKLSRYDVPQDRPLARQAIAGLQASITEAFGKAALSVRRQLTERLGKADEDADDRADRVAADLDLGDLDTIADGWRDLYDVSSDAGIKAIAQVGPESADDLTDQVNDVAASWSRGRAAELVGKRITDDGALVDNPNAEYAIDQSTRDMIRILIADGLRDNIGTPAIADSIADATAGLDHPFSDARAELIAETEVSRANEQGKLIGYRENGIPGKSWLIADEEACPLCQENEDAGAIGIDDDFPSGDDAAPGHPKCRCVIIPELNVGDDEDDD